LYTDDWVIGGKAAANLQKMMDLLTKGFGSVGLLMNIEKTETMMIQSTNPHLKKINYAYTIKITRQGLSFKERSKINVI
jgi:hypothetical protein